MRRPVWAKEVASGTATMKRPAVRDEERRYESVEVPNGKGSKSTAEKSGDEREEGSGERGKRELQVMVEGLRGEASNGGDDRTVQVRTRAVRRGGWEAVKGNAA